MVKKTQWKYPQNIAKDSCSNEENKRKYLKIKKQKLTLKSEK